MKKLFVTALVVLFALPAFAWEWTKVDQPWVYDTVLDSASGCHGVVVDNNDRIWTANYYETMKVFNPDGSLHARIDSLLVPGAATTGADSFIHTDYSRGINIDNDGNIVYARGNRIMKINPETLECEMAWNDGAGSLTKPAIDDEGYIYVGLVVGTGPVSLLDPADYSLVAEYELPGAPGFARGIEVSGDGTTIFTGNLDGGAAPVYVYTTEDYVSYEKSDSLFVDAAGDSIFGAQKTMLDWGPDGKLWVSQDDSYAQPGEPQLINALVGFDFDTEEYGYVWMPDPGDSLYTGPRGVAFNSTGDVAYVGNFNAGVVYRYVKAEDIVYGPWQEVSNEWEFSAVFDSASGCHGVVVDNNDRIWTANYYETMRVFNPDGSLHAQIDSLLVPGAATTGADSFIHTNYSRGINIDNDGNIVYARGNRVMKINPESLECEMAWNDGAGSLTKPAIDDEGYIYVGLVVGTGPVSLLDPADYSLVAEYELEGAPSYARAIEVSGDGTTIFTGNLGGSGSPVYVYTTEDYVSYSKTDSIYTNTSGEEIFSAQLTMLDWGPDGKLWVSHDDAYAEPGAPQLVNALFGFDWDTKEYTKVMMPDPADSLYTGPRGVAFSSDGNTAYVGSFNAGVLYKYTRPSAVWSNTPDAMPVEFQLGQNYPNPFNPTTTIPFTLETSGDVTLQVFDVTGRQVQELVNRRMMAGSHQIDFDGSNLASGVYYYKLEVNGSMATNKMMLVK
jgi:sugar lactone lactonase YvrE